MEETTHNKVGRPDIFTKELADEVCKRIADGKSLRSVCKENDMPGMTTVFKWLRENEGFTKQYARACVERTEAQQEEMLEIGDNAISHSETADPKAANAVVSAYKLKADNLKWSMSKMQPKKYGDKVDVTSDGKQIKGNTIMFGNFKEDEN